MQRVAIVTISKLKRERGAAAVEFALVLPLVVLLIFGLIDFGRLFFVQISLSSASMEVARVSSYVQNSCVVANSADASSSSCYGMVEPTSSTPLRLSQSYLNEIQEIALATSPGVKSMAYIKSNAPVNYVVPLIKQSCHLGLTSLQSPGVDTEIQLSTGFDWLLPVDFVFPNNFRVKATGYVKCLD